MLNNTEKTISWNDSNSAKKFLWYEKQTIE